MTPHQASALEAELRRLASEAFRKARADRSLVGTVKNDGRTEAYTHAADLVRDAAKGE